MQKMTKKSTRNDNKIDKINMTKKTQKWHKMAKNDLNLTKNGAKKGFS